MKFTQSDYEERKARVAAGTGTDEDSRLIKQYEREGYEVKDVSPVGKLLGEKKPNTDPPAPPPATASQEYSSSSATTEALPRTGKGK